jgi:uncharacterized protein YjbI with pentapeptide repeats
MNTKPVDNLKAIRPRFLADEAFRQLRCGDVDGYHRNIAARTEVDFSYSDLRGTDLRNADLAKVKLTGAYLRDTDLRGQDLRQHDLEGCSLYHAHISGVWFPADFSAEEIRLSLEQGTRLRRR